MAEEKGLSGWDYKPNEQKAKEVEEMFGKDFVVVDEEEDAGVKRKTKFEDSVADRAYIDSVAVGRVPKAEEMKMEEKEEVKEENKKETQAEKNER